MSTQPKMHHCLKVPELFSAICSSSENNELLQLSLTCRSLCSGALDALWHSTPEGITALLCCFPDDVIESTGGGGPESSSARPRLSVRRNPGRDQWGRVQFYASRMRELHISDTYPWSGTPTDECYHIFLYHCPYFFQILFPNLRGATLDSATHEMGSLLFTAIAFALPLRKLGIRFYGLGPSRDFHLMYMETAFRARKESVETLSIQFQGIHPDLVSGLAAPINDALCTFTALQEVNLNHSCPLSSDALSHLALLPNLRRLSFMYTQDFDDDQLLTPNPDNFRSLSTLDLRIDEVIGLDEECVLFDNIHSPCLKTLSILFDREPLIACLLDLVRSIARHTFLQQLQLVSRAVELGVPWEPEDPDDWPIRCSSMLSTLSPLSCLHALQISYLPLHITPDDIHTIARLWPELQTLELGATDEFTTTTIRAADLHPLVTGCPHMQKVTLSILGKSDDVLDGGLVGEQHLGAGSVIVCPRRSGGIFGKLAPEHMAVLRHMFPQAEVEVAGGTGRGGEIYGVGVQSSSDDEEDGDGDEESIDDDE